MQNCRRSYNISNEEYATVLSFLHAIKNSGGADIRRNILEQINRFFGYVGSSFWMVNEDFSLTNPVGANIDMSLLEDYEEVYHKYDTGNPQKVGATIFGSADVIDQRHFIKIDKNNPYHSRLHDHNIYHAYALQLKAGGKVRASIALFRPWHEKDDPLDASAMRCLELVTPFLSQEFETQTLLDEKTRSVSLFRSALNMENTGVVLFEQEQGNQVIYHNPACTLYCHDFFRKDDAAGNIVQRFVDSVIVPYDSPFPEISDLTVKLKSLQGTSYRIRIVENTEAENGEALCAAYINPLREDHVIIEDTKFPRLYSLLTPKEREVTLLVAQGLTNQQIADRMFISLSTVKSHLQRIFEKFHVGNRTSLIASLSPKD